VTLNYISLLVIIVIGARVFFMHLESINNWLFQSTGCRRRFSIQILKLLVVNLFSPFAIQTNKYFFSDHFRYHLSLHLDLSSQYLSFFFILCSSFYFLNKFLKFFFYFLHFLYLFPLSFVFFLLLFIY